MPYHTLFGSVRVSPEEQAENRRLVKELKQAVAAIIREEAEHKAAAEKAAAEKAAAEKAAAERKKKEAEHPKSDATSSAGNFREPEGRFSLITEHDSFIPDTFDDTAAFRSFVISQMIDPSLRDRTFSEQVAAIIQTRGLRASAVYKRADVDKTLFSKMMAGAEYTPSKNTAIAIAFGLGLDLDGAKDLIGRAGYTFSHSMERDIFLECCFKKRLSDVIEVNLLLNAAGYPPLSKSA